MKKITVLLISVLLSGGCAGLKQISTAPKSLFEPNLTRYFLSCFDDLHGLESEEFADQFKTAQKGLPRSGDSGKLRFICLSLHVKADHQKFIQGRKLLEEYLAEHPNSTEENQRVRILVDRLAEDHVLINELQQQIDQLKNIENIIKNRETAQP